MNRAGAALAGIATDMGAREPEILPKELYEQQPRLDIRGDRFSVHGHCYRCHEILPCILFRRLVVDAQQTPESQLRRSFIEALERRSTSNRRSAFFATHSAWQE